MILCTVTTLHASEPQEKKWWKLKQWKRKYVGKWKWKRKEKRKRRWKCHAMPTIKQKLIVWIFFSVYVLTKGYATSKSALSNLQSTRRFIIKKTLRHHDHLTFTTVKKSKKVRTQRELRILTVIFVKSYFYTSLYSTIGSTNTTYIQLLTSEHTRSTILR